MRGPIFLAAIVLYSSIERRATASYCYPDACQNLTDLVPTPDFQCLLTPVQRGEDCARLKFDADEKSCEREKGAIFTLHAYVTKFDAQRRATAFNLSVSDVNFRRLITRYQNIDNEKENACRHVQLHGNANQQPPLKDFYVSCPFSDAAFEGSAYRLEYLVIGEDHTYNEKYIFHVPHHELIEDDIRIDVFTPFIYVDVSDLALYVQPLPPRYNVTRYVVWLISNDTGSTVSTIISANGNGGGHIRFNFSAPDGVYRIKVAALHPGCGERGCANSTSPYIHIRQVSHRLLIMIISLIWIPPVLLYALYHAFKLYRKRVLKRLAVRPKCLLVYSPTHPAHVNVMMELTKYLRCCSINAMIDMFDIAETASKDPGLWCNAAFQAADVVLVATSPITSAKSDSTIVYRNVDNHFLRLLKENYPQRNKRYYAIHLPYCKSNHIPEEARMFNKFRMPEDLTKLVRTIHGIGCMRFLTASDRELLESIRYATTKIFEDVVGNATRNTEETDDLLPPVVMQVAANQLDDGRPVEIRSPDTPDGNIIPQSFTTNIDELNLLGENRDGEVFAFNPTRKDCEFRVDNLNL